MFVIVTGVTACNVNPTLVNWLVSFARMPFGAIEERETVSYTVQGSTEEYESIEELLISNNLNVYYPSVLPNNIKLNGIEIIAENNINVLSFKFPIADFHFTIQLNNSSKEWNQPVVSEIDANGLHFDVYFIQGYYIGHSEIQGDSYLIQSKEINDIILVVGGLKKV
jgi:hypothetical protein